MKIKDVIENIRSWETKKKVIYGTVVVVALSGIGCVSYASYRHFNPKDNLVAEKETMKPIIELTGKTVKVVKGKEVNAGEIIKTIKTEDGLKEVKFSEGEVKNEINTFDAKGIPNKKLKFDTVGIKSITITATSKEGMVATATVKIEVVEELEAYVTGIRDLTVELNAQNVDYMKGITFDKKLVKEVLCDSSKVDLTTVGDYAIEYKITGIDETKVAVFKKVMVKVISAEDAQKMADKGEVVITQNGEVKKDSKGNAPVVKNDTVAVADGTKGTSGAPSQSGNVTPPTQSNNNSNSNASKPKPEASKPSDQTPPAHTHSWVQNYRTEEYVVSEAWTENIMGTRDVYGTRPTYTEVAVVICNVCGHRSYDMGTVVAHQKDHALNDDISGYHTEYEQKETGSEQYVIGQEQYVASTVNHPAVMGTRQVPNGYTCSCGATK